MLSLLKIPGRYVRLCCLAVCLEGWRPRRYDYDYGYGRRLGDFDGIFLFSLSFFLLLVNARQNPIDILCLLNS